MFTSTTDLFFLLSPGYRSTLSVELRAWLGPAAAARMGSQRSSQLWPPHAEPGGLNLQLFSSSEVASETNRLLVAPVPEGPDNLLSVRAVALNKMLLASKTQSAGMTRKNNLQYRWG